MHVSIFLKRLFIQAWTYQCYNTTFLKDRAYKDIEVEIHL